METPAGPAARSSPPEPADAPAAGTIGFVQRNLVWAGLLLLL